MDAETREALRIVGNALENAPSRPRSQGKQALSRIEQTLRDLSERTSRAEHINLFEMVCAERDALAERVERAEREVADWKADGSQWADRYVAQRKRADAAEAEAARLREALRDLMDYGQYDTADPSPQASAARAALSPPTDGETRDG